MQDLIFLKNQAIELINAAQDPASLDSLRVAYLGKKGKLTELLKTLSTLSAEEKPKLGQLINLTKQEISRSIEEKLEVFKQQILEKKLQAEKIDVTLPGRLRETGRLHPITQVKQKINIFFSNLGFQIVTGPEIETEFFNFEALNIPEHHPARAMHDTFYFENNHLLRTHTSPVQIRMMMESSPPLRLIAPGRVYRCDSDVTHTPMFHQVEGLLIDKTANFANLKDLLQDFFVYFFEQTVQLRFRPSYFPFTEPSAEVDISCTSCSGKGCRSCKFTGWLEVLGCGMVHPNVLKAVNISPEDYQGWAFGMGIDRLAMLYFGVQDLRALFENDLMFLKQF